MVGRVVRRTRRVSSLVAGFAPPLLAWRAPTALPLAFALLYTACLVRLVVNVLPSEQIWLS